MSKEAFGAALVVTTLCAVARADTITVESGEVFTGVITAETRNTLRMEIGGAAITIPKSKIAKVAYSRREIPAWRPEPEEGGERGGDPPAGRLSAAVKKRGEKPPAKDPGEGAAERARGVAGRAVSGALLARMWGEKVDAIENNMWHFRGTVNNVFKKTMRYVRVTVRVYDKYGNYIREASDLCSPATIPRGQSGYYDVAVPFDMRIARFHTDCAWR